MKYWRFDLGEVAKGHSVEVTLVCSANVRLIDTENLRKFETWAEHDYIGGYVKFAPYTIIVPRTAEWHIVVDLGGYAGEVKTLVKVIQGIKKKKDKTVKLPEVEKEEPR